MRPEQRLVSRLLTVFGEPKTDDPIAYMNELERAVTGYSAEVLERSGDEVIKRSKFWPRPAEILEKADRIAALIEAEQHRRNPPPPEPELPPPTPEQVARAKAIVAKAKAAMSAAEDKPKPLPRVNREAFEAMMKTSPNQHLYAGALARRITGERD
jgi:hypothetical protein